MKAVFHVSDDADEVQNAAIRYVSGIFNDPTVEMDHVAVVANAAGIVLVRTDSTYAEEIRELSAGEVEFVACEKSLEAAELIPDDVLDVVETAPTSVGELTRRQETGYRYIKVP